MPRISKALLLALTTVALILATSTPVSSQSPLPAPRSRVLQAVDDAHVTTLSGNTHPLARPEFDQGALTDATPLRRIVLVLQRGPEQESALQQLIDQQQDKTSSTYHQWLTPETFGATFGPTDRDLSAVTTWLSGHGFSGVQVNSARTLIEFSGTAGMVRTAFRTSMHKYAVNGEQHFANASDPTVPAALAPIIAGIASLNNFPRKAASHKVGTFRHNAITNLTTRVPDRAQTVAQPTFTINESSNVSYGVTPYDFATIYNVLPLWNESTPIDGTGQTIAIVGQTDINPADFVNFRRLFGLPLGNTATPTGTQYLNIIYNGPNPGVTGDEGEADIDTQWSSAVAKGATIDYVVSQGTEVTQGTDLSAIYIVNNNLAPVMSYSYGECELFLGTSGNAFYKTLWQQASAQGITVLLAAGDSGSAGCDYAGVQGASDGIAVNGLASTPYNISVGGTDFYMPNGGTAYWSSTNNATTQASAKGYVPEVPWNESCTNSVFSTLPTFSGQTAEQICNSGTAAAYGLLSVVGSGGGPSSCTQSNGTSAASCRGGYPKPSWQTGTGVPADGVRDTPDVSLFASAGFFGAFYIVCQQSTDSDSQPCSLSGPAYDFAGYGGTSVSSPAFAGVLALVNQKTGSRQGNANYALYNLAGQQAKAGIACNSITGSPAANCVFNDLTTDTTAMPCLKGTLNCTATTSTDRYGVLSGYPSTAGYDLASGLGSVNAANLVNSWANANFVASSATLTLSQSTITHGSPISATVKVSSTTGTPAGNVSINALATNGSAAERYPPERQLYRLAQRLPRRRLLGPGPLRWRRRLRPQRLQPRHPYRQPRVEHHHTRVDALQPLRRHHRDPLQRRYLPLWRHLPRPRRCRRSLQAGKRHRQHHAYRFRPSARWWHLPTQLNLEHRGPCPRPRPRYSPHHRHLLGRRQLQPKHLGPLHHQHHSSTDRHCTSGQRSRPLRSVDAHLYSPDQCAWLWRRPTSGLRRRRSQRHGHLQLRQRSIGHSAPHPEHLSYGRRGQQLGHLHPSCQPAADCHQHNHSHLHGRRQLRTLHLGVCDGDGHRFHAGRKLNRPYTLRGDRSGRRPLHLYRNGPAANSPTHWLRHLLQ